MTTYINPADKISAIGTILRSGDLPGLRQEAGYNFVVGVYDRGIFRVAPVLANKEDFAEFERQYNQGAFISRKFYAIGADKIDEHGNLIDD